MSSKKSGTDFSLSVSFHATDRLKSVPLLLIALARQDRVEEERESRQALGAVLRAKSEEDDAALADIRLDHRRATADEFVAENPSAQQWALRFGITRDRAGAPSFSIAKLEALLNVITVPPASINSRSALTPASPNPPAYSAG